MGKSNWQQRADQAIAAQQQAELVAQRKRDAEKQAHLAQLQKRLDYLERFLDLENILSDINSSTTFWSGRGLVSSKRDSPVTEGGTTRTYTLTSEHAAGARLVTEEVYRKRYGTQEFSHGGSFDGLSRTTEKVRGWYDKHVGTRAADVEIRQAYPFLRISISYSRSDDTFTIKLGDSVTPEPEWSASPPGYYSRPPDRERSITGRDLQGLKDELDQVLLQSVATFTRSTSIPQQEQEAQIEVKRLRRFVGKWVHKDLSGEWVKGR